jgi:hypothetical protein
LLIRLRGYLINVGAEKFGFGRKIAARRRFFRRPQQSTEPIGVLYFADILPGQVAKAIKGKKRIYRPVLNRGRLNAESSFQFRTEPVQFQYLFSHVVLFRSFDQGRGNVIPLWPRFQKPILGGEPYGAGGGIDEARPITSTVLKRAAAAAPCALLEAEPSSREQDSGFHDE